MSAVELAEVLRYMGVKGQPDEAVIALAEKAVTAVAAAVTPRFVWRRMALVIEGARVRLDDFEIVSADLAGHLHGCDGALLFASTLGSGADLLLARDGRLHPALAVAEQAAAAAMIEQYCDDCCDRLAAQQSETGRYLRPRYSPGYGDFSVETQPTLLTLLDAPRRIGLSATDSHMLTPMKSVTAVIGLSNKAQPCRAGRCDGCTNTGCVFRRT